jgi:hypothetical protein
MGLLGKNSIITIESKYHVSHIGGFYYINDLWFSKAYNKLRKSSQELLHCFILERRWKKGNQNDITNNESISFTEVQFKEIFGYSPTTYLKARNQLIEHGFIIQTYKGGMCRGDMARYKILCLPDVKYGEQRWRDYPEKNWSNDIPKEKNNQVGINTRWKKGKSGRKTKATLPKCTHTELNDPIKVDPKK